MPRKIRQLEADLKKAGFEKVKGKGSHRRWVHQSGAYVTMSGNEGDDAKHYQEKDVSEAIQTSTRPA